MADEFFYKVVPDAPEQGPIDAKSLKQLAASGELTPESVLRRGSGDWVAAASVKGLEIASTAEPVYPEAIPVSTLPETASPVTASPVTVPPEAVPVMGPVAAASPKGLSLPGVVPPKASPEVPAGIGALNLGNKKGTEAPVAKPALDLPQGFSDARRDGVGKTPMALPVRETETAKPAMTFPSKASPKAGPTRPAVGNGVEATNGAAETAEAEPPATAANPFAMEPSPRPARPRRGGGLGSLFSFDTLIGPTVIKTLFYLGVAAILLSWAGFSAFVIVPALIAGETMAIVGALFASGMMLIPAFFYVVMVRVTTEMVIIFFQIHDDVRDMREQMESRTDGSVRLPGG